MALTPKLSNAGANAAADATCALLNGGYLDIYDGVQPATADTAVGAQVKLARLTFGTPAFSAAAGGVATANAIGADASADATGTASWFRACTAGGAAVFDGSVGTSGANLNLNTTSIAITGNVAVSSLTYTQSKG